MALSNVDKLTITRLFEMIDSNSSDNNKEMSTRLNDYSAYSKLQIIVKQIEFLKQQAIEILDTHNMTNIIKQAEYKFSLKTGNYYYLYYHNEKYVLSLVDNTDSMIYDKFISKLYYDYDYQFKIIE